ncbi:DNA-directed DNA polymerase [Handroanthus impetiginosus]|uniref:RNA-directed DNA polymerase n=1 Tax=Handroanthus impetiginosus TaxID=429701 RepID=A0A2G9G234_9LAMI|nr:DNA-directed DNA polymerase [Handroanthus impetiginosus]
MSSYVKFMKDILSKKKRLGDYETVALTEECSAIIQNKLPPKLKNLESFTIPCTIGTHFSGRALCDLGASINLIPYSIYRTLGLGEGVIEDILVKVDKFIFPADFIIVDMEADSEIPIILGRPFLATRRTLIDVQKGELTIRVQNQQITFNVFKAMKFSNESDECFSISILDNLAGKESIAERPLDPLERALLDLIDEKNEEDLKVVKTLDASKLFKSRGVEKLLRMLRDHKCAIGWTATDIKRISPSFCMHKILLEDDQKLSVESQRRLNPIMKEVVKKKIIKWLDAGIIDPIFYSSWVSPVQCVPKKGGITMVPNMYNELIPTRTMLDRLVGEEFYCFLDGYSGYNQMAIAPEDQEKTTFTCPYGTFTFRRIPFGLCNAPATFQRCMMAIFTDMIENFLEVFMDDFSIYGNSFDECLNNLSSALKRYKDTNLVLNWKKCHFMVQEGIVLDHKVFNKGIEVDKTKLETIEKLPPPISVKSVRSFLGHVGFYRCFIKDFSKISKFLCNLLEKDVPFKFNDACLYIFNDLKGRLISTPIIIVPDWTFPFELMCDTSDFAIGAVLGQQKDKIFQLLAVVFAFEKFRSYFVGTKVIVYADHFAIRYLIEKKDVKPRLIRWVLLLQEFDIEIRDRKGTKNEIANHLSRLESPVKTDYADIVNYLTCGIISFDLSTQQKKKFLFDTRRYFWDEPFLFKQYSDNILRRCVLEIEMNDILE